MERQFNYLGFRGRGGYLGCECKRIVWGIQTKMSLTWTRLRHNETFGDVLNTPLIGF